MKILYVLVSGGRDYYYEQFLLSLTSLRMVMPDAFVSLLTDDGTAKTFVDRRNTHAKDVNECIVVDLPEEMSNKVRSRWLKTSMRQHIEGDFLYIDCDTVIADDLSSIGRLNVNLGMVYDLNYPFLDKTIQQRAVSLMKRFSSGFSVESAPYFNSGLIFCKDNQINRNFFSEWHNFWLYTLSKGIITDQTSLNHINVMLHQPIEALDGIWNCQIVQGGLPYLYNAKILHYFATRKTIEKPFLLADKNIFEIIREQGITPKIWKMIENQKTQFSNKTYLMADEKELALFNSSLFRFLIRRQRVTAFIFSIISVMRYVKRWKNTITFRRRKICRIK